MKQAIRMILRPVGVAAAALMAAFAGGSAIASTVVPMSVRTLSDLSGQVIVGDVASVRSYWAESPHRIETEVLFSHVEYLKGRHAGATDSFTLTVPGGTVGETTARLACAPEFRIGERRLLFLLPTYKTFPTAGLDQGAFQIITDAQGVARVYLNPATPVMGIDAEGFPLARGSEPSTATEHARESHNLRIHPPADLVAEASATRGDIADSALTVEAFLEILKPILDASVDHHMTSPAGRRILVEYRAVPMQSASSSEAARGTNSRAQSARLVESKATRPAKREPKAAPDDRETADVSKPEGKR